VQSPRSPFTLLTKVKHVVNRNQGLELSGWRSSQSALCTLDHHVSSKRLVLRDLRILEPSNDNTSADEALLQMLRDTHTLPKASFKNLVVQAPLSIPPGLRLALKSGKKPSQPFRYSDPELKWMRALWSRVKPRPHSILPYLQRPAELHLRHATPEKFQIPDAFGANVAPLAARMLYLKPYLPKATAESWAKAALQRLVVALGMPKTLFRDYASLEEGASTRAFVLEELNKKLPQLFVYEKDEELLIGNLAAFHAFVLALVGHWKQQQLTEDPPKGFPKESSWIYLPKRSVSLQDIF
jgi:hypothetical protein